MAIKRAPALVTYRCSGCARVFATAKAFDDHQAGRKPRNGKGTYRPGGQCYNPADTGQVQDAAGRWALPSPTRRSTT